MEHLEHSAKEEIGSGGIMLCSGKDYGEGAPVARAALHINFAAVGLGNCLGQTES